jgi:hypothetical protein
MTIKRHLSFNALRKKMSKTFLTLNDHRDSAKVSYRLHDVLMSGFAMMFYQDKSMLEFQRRLQEKKYMNNLKSLFNVQSIPKDTQMRDVIDKVDSSIFESIFKDYFKALQRGKHLESYQIMGNNYLITMDGSGYFSSNKINCDSCLHKETKSGIVWYEHQILQACLMHPNKKQVIPLMPEEIKNSDGKDKQDCEINAAKRLLEKIRKSHPKLKVIIGGDSLYSKQPMIEAIKAKNMRYVLTAKENDHKILMEWINEQRQLKEVSQVEIKDKKGRRHIYEWINEVPLNGNKNTLLVNYFEYWIKNENNDVTYHNSWVTDINIDKDNVLELVKTGRSRWKIENETFNILKNHGYHIEHNYGHGKKHLSMNFFILNLLAFYMHQIFELTDRLYQQCREKFHTKSWLWENLRVFFQIMIFKDWETFLNTALNPP